MTFHYQQKDGPLLLSFPHDGCDIPSNLASRMTHAGRSSVDTDWYVSSIYDFAKNDDISYIRAKHSRFVVDLNRPPDGAPLYSGQTETGLCSIQTFAGESIYLAGQEPDTAEIQQRVDQYWRPYHAHLQTELTRIKNKHGYAILWDAHSIRGRVPCFFDGVLPDLNFGTANQQSCAPRIRETIHEITQAQTNYSFVFDGRFKGGYITRHYGNPADHVHAVQLEINQQTYLETEWPVKVSSDQLKQLSSLVKKLLNALVK